MRHLQAFVLQEFKVNDISFNRINRSFIKDFEMYLKNNCANGHNSAMKLLQILKKVYRIAVDNRWTSGNAFNGKHLSYKDVDIEVLTDTEIEALKQLEIQQGYLVKTRDILLFCIYTGQAYVDMQSVQRRHLVYNPETREYLIKKKREKTGVEYMLPLFHPARRQLGKWNTAWESAAPDTFLVPRISNQKFNNYIKELMALAGIQKKLASHSFRHTFATTITLENGVPIESVSRMMGHSKISETQRYGKVTAIKIERETKALFEKLSERKIG
jgi:site-specific recombinase XerD